MPFNIQQAGLGLAAIAGFTLFVGSVSPSRKEVAESLIILAPADIVWEQISLLENQAAWADYTSKDLYTKLFFEGTDGKYGASMLWDGSGNTGAGTQRTVAIKKNTYYQGKIRISRPQRAEADLNIKMQRLAGHKGIKVDYLLGYVPSAKTKALSLFTSERQLTSTVSHSLQKLKKRCEQLAKVRKDYGAIITVKMASSAIFVGQRKRIRLQNLIPNQKVGGRNIMQLLADEGKETDYPATLYYDWNERNGTADIATVGSVLVQLNFLDSGYQNFYLSARRYVVAECIGDLRKIDATHRAINAYLRDHKLKPQYPIIEKHIVGPAHDAPPSHWHTRIMYPID